jgi:phage terminase large subunit-like protein
MSKRSTCLYLEDDLIQQAKRANINLSHGFNDWLKGLLLIKDTIIDTKDTTELQTRLNDHELKLIEEQRAVNSIKDEIKNIEKEHNKGVLMRRRF